MGVRRCGRTIARTSSGVAEISVSMRICAMVEVVREVHAGRMCGFMDSPWGVSNRPLT
jgi:hypothetical protein